jgi:hypothetical protein
VRPSLSRRGPLPLEIVRATNSRLRNPTDLEQGEDLWIDSTSRLICIGRVRHSRDARLWNGMTPQPRWHSRVSDRARLAVAATRHASSLIDAKRCPAAGFTVSALPTNVGLVTVRCAHNRVSS